MWLICSKMLLLLNIKIKQWHMCVCTNLDVYISIQTSDYSSLINYVISMYFLLSYVCMFSGLNLLLYKLAIVFIMHVCTPCQLFQQNFKHNRCVKSIKHNVIMKIIILIYPNRTVTVLNI